MCVVMATLLKVDQHLYVCTYIPTRLQYAIYNIIGRSRISYWKGGTQSGWLYLSGAKTYPAVVGTCIRRSGISRGAVIISGAPRVDGGKCIHFLLDPSMYNMQYIWNT